VRIDYATGNWAEGLTTYQADYALAADRGTEAAREMRRGWLAGLTRMPPDQDTPLRAFRSSGASGRPSIGYGKAAMVFHMLRQAQGVDGFQAAIRRYWQAQTGRAAGWAQIETAFAEESGAALSDYFAQWLDRPGLPRVTLAAASARKIEAGYELSLDLRQEGGFALDLPIEIATTEGPIRRVLTLDGGTGLHGLTVPHTPQSVTLDPGFDALRQLQDPEMPALIRDFQRADTITLWTDGAAPKDFEPFLEALLGSADQVELGKPGTLPKTGTLLVLGETWAVLGLRRGHFEASAPARATQGELRAWSERDPSGRTWLFVSAADTAALNTRLSTLRFYGNQSYVMLRAATAPEFGRWPAVSPSVPVEQE
jgi:aminopeptidase N